MNTLLTANDFIYSLVHATRKEYNTIIEQACNNPKLFEAYATWSDDSYTRNCLYRNENFELILICWEQNQKTSIHNHGGEECWLGMLEGKLTEEHFIDGQIEQLEKIQEEILHQGEVSYINDNLGIHRLGNASDKRAMSLHLYANPIDKCDYFCEERKRFVPKTLSYDTCIQDDSDNLN